MDGGREEKSRAAAQRARERRKRKVEANEALLTQEIVQAEQQREAIAMLAMKDAFEAEVQRQNQWLDSQRLQREDEFAKVLDTFHKIMNERRKQLSTLRRARPGVPSGQVRRTSLGCCRPCHSRSRPPPAARGWAAPSR